MLPCTSRTLMVDFCDLASRCFSRKGAVSVGCGPLNGLVSSGRERPDHSTSQITSPLNGRVIFLKSLYADVCELASSVGRELGAHSGLRRMET